MKKWSVRLDLAFPVLIGMALFLWFGGFHVINPLKIGYWMNPAAGDATQHYIGWSFFRNTSFLQIPIGLNYPYGEVLGSSIVFSDSIPLFAFLFKAISRVLPADFQYFGIWIALCFVLQAFFAWRIIALYTSSLIYRLGGTVLLVLSPAMLLRLPAHEALGAHWLLLAALFLYLRDTSRMLGWVSLILLASLVHAYLLILVLSIWAANLVRRLIDRSRTFRETAVEGVAVVLSLSFTMWMAGYFVLQSVHMDGFGYYRHNLLGFLNPLEIWSIWFKGVNHGGDYEGFSYVGGGILVLSVVVISLILLRGNELRWTLATVGPLAGLCIVLYAYAISNQVAVGESVLISYKVPGFLKGITSSFRASGRFVWPVLYVVEIGLLYVFLRLVRSTQVAVGTLCAVALIQIADLNGAATHYRQKWMQSWQNPLVSTFWVDVPRQYTRIAIVRPLANESDYSGVAYLAARNGMTMAGGYFARLDYAKVAAVESELELAVRTGHYRADSIYVFNNQQLWEAAHRTAHDGDFVGVIDGIKVLAPGWKGCVLPTCE